MSALVSIRNGGVFANSRDVAAKFGKRHDNVLRDIDDLIRQDVPGFVEVRAETAVGFGTRLDRAFNMSRDAFMLLAMGFTGKSALRWKLRYIEAFNAMEVRLRQPAALPDAAIRAELDQMRAEIAQLRTALAAPRRVAFDPERMVLRFIKSREVMPRGLLSRKVDGRVSPEELDEVCARLERAGKIETLRIENTGGRPATIYVAC